MLNKTVLFKEKNIAILLEMLKGETIATKLSENNNVTYSHIVGILKKLEKEGIVVKENEGRKKNLNLTIKGRGIAEHIKKIYEKLGYLDVT